MATAEQRCSTTPLHDALAAINQEEQTSNDERTPLIAAKVRGLVFGYNARWINWPFIPERIEGTVRAPLLNPETQARSRTFELAGKLDLVGYNPDTFRTGIIDHKTTSLDIEDPAGPYWRQLTVESQPSHYALLEWINGRKVDDVIWDVTRKPTIAPKKLSKKDRTTVLETGKYYSFDVPDDDLEAFAYDDEGRETLKMYTFRLSHDCTFNRPLFYFQRRQVPRLDGDLLDYAQQLWEHGQDIIHTRRNDRHLPNSGACMLYGTPCKFLGICSGHDTPDSDNWQRKENVHAELPELDGDGRDVLTNSRIRCFQTCRKKHYFEYEIGLERQDEQEKEALYFGHLYHLALNAWWGAKLQPEK